MLSNAPEDPNEAIVLEESIVLARETGIKNVVFISDACRSQAETLGAARVRGGVIFPNRRTFSQTRTDVDRFLATHVGDLALEVPVRDSVAKYEGIYTSVFLSAYRHPDAGMVNVIDGVRVVPNNRLRDYLEREVKRIAAEKHITLKQIPDAQVVSPDNTYLGKVADADKTSATAISPSPTIFDLASSELSKVGINPRPSNYLPSEPSEEKAIDDYARETGFSTARDAILGARTTAEVQTFETGFFVSGARLELVHTSPWMRTGKMLSFEGKKPQEKEGILQIETERPGSVVLAFDNGSITVLAVLPGFIGTVVVDGRGVSNVNYEPSRHNFRWSGNEGMTEHYRQLRAAVATAARFGVFRIEGKSHSERSKAAESLADNIRVLKGYDPTLGLYAAYAYAEANLIDQVRSVQQYMLLDLDTVLFDIAMLSGSLADKPPRYRGEAGFPFCPMLSQGWNLLRVNRVNLPPGVDSARDHLLPALWTTFDEQAMDTLVNALKVPRD
jgi:hypothetical protein